MEQPDWAALHAAAAAEARDTPDLWLARNILHIHVLDWPSGLAKGEPASHAIPVGESVSQQITRLLGTDDWAILHSGHEMVTDVGLDEIEAAS